MSSLNDAEQARTFFEEELDIFSGEYYPSVNELSKAIGYALSGKGKRVRPVLSMLACQSFGQDFDKVLPASLAVEMIHTYSLLHDDLPCMDDDDLRRGRPTVHKVFGEAQALLAGDALLTDSFDVLLNWGDPMISSKRKIQQVAELSMASGSKGMVQGQSMDLYWTEREGATEEDIDDIHLGKTGNLMGASCALGAIAGGATPEQVLVLRNFGRTVGLAFQIFDDILDNTEHTGKTQGKDLEAGKLTYLRFMNAEEAKINAEKLTEAAVESLLDLNIDSESLVEYTTTLLRRTF